MTADLIQHAFHGQAVRSLADGAGQAWFVLNDLCGILGIQNVGNVLARLADDQKSSIRLTDGTPGNPTRALVNESGMWTVILRSDSPSAEPVRRWVTDDVLPSIRRHGLYATPSTVEAMLDDPDTVIELLTKIKDERAEKAVLAAKVAADAPKVLFADAVATSHTDILVRDLAKILRGNDVEVGGTRLFEWLRRDGFLIRAEGRDYNSPTQRAMEMSLFRVKETAITHSDGRVGVSKTPLVTGKGQAYFVNRYAGLDGAAVAS